MTPTSSSRDHLKGYSSVEELEDLEYSPSQSYNWAPGVALPISTPRSHHASNFYTPRPVPIHRQLQRDDPVPAHHHLMANNLPHADASEQTILESILSSQKQMQETMNKLLYRVDALEDTVKDSSVSTSSHDEKKVVRLSSELCVSYC